MTQYLPGLSEPGEHVDVTSFERAPRTYVATAKWWYKPILWIAGKPTTFKETR